MSSLVNMIMSIRNLVLLIIQHPQKALSLFHHRCSSFFDSKCDFVSALTPDERVVYLVYGFLREHSENRVPRDVANISLDFVGTDSDRAELFSDQQLMSLKESKQHRCVYHTKWMIVCFKLVLDIIALCMVHVYDLNEMVISSGDSLNFKSLDVHKWVFVGAIVDIMILVIFVCTLPMVIFVSLSIRCLAMGVESDHEFYGEFLNIIDIDISLHTLFGHGSYFDFWTMTFYWLWATYGFVLWSNMDGDPDEGGNENGNGTGNVVYSQMILFWSIVQYTLCWVRRSVASK